MLKYTTLGLVAVLGAGMAQADVIAIGTLTDTSTAAIDVSGWDVGETYYFQYTVTGAANAGGQVTGLGLDSGAGEQVFAGDGFGDGTPWAIFTAGGVNQGTSAVPALTGDPTIIVLAATRGATDADNTFNFYVAPNLGLDEGSNTATISGGLTTADLDGVIQVRAITNTGDLTDITVYTEGDTPFVPEPTSLALLGLSGVLVARRRRG